MALLAGCGERPQDRLQPNVDPHIKFTGAPFEGSSAPYQARLYWIGWDDDGVVDHYEFAVDPPSAFTHEEIAAPERSPGLKRVLIPGRAGAGDTVRVTKTVDGIAYRFDYVTTRATDREFDLSTPDADSLVTGSGRVPARTFSGTHVIYLRCRDDAGGYSDAARTGFQADNFTPSARITGPNTGGVIYTGGRINIKWTGDDPDPPAVGVKPVRYYYKLVDLRALTPPLSVFKQFDPEDAVFHKAVDIPWTPRSADTLGITLDLPVPGEYLFAVRAEDALGAEEPFVDFWRSTGQGNAILIRSSQGAGQPGLTITERDLGTFVFTNPGQAYKLETGVGLKLRFQWSANAEPYGGIISGFSWGVDIADLDQEGPGSGWSPWGNVAGNSTPVVFTTPGIHTVYVRVKDDAGTITTGTLIFNVADFTFDRGALVVDDFLDTTYPRDSEHDQFWLDRIQESGRFGSGAPDPSQFLYATGGTNDQGFLNPTAPGLSVIGKYKLLIWFLKGSGFCNRTGLFNAVVNGTALRTYLSLGGQIWVCGSTTLSATRTAGTICNKLPAGDASYPLSFAPGDFAWDMLHIRTDKVDDSKGSDVNNAMVGVKAWNQEDPILPDMDADPGKFLDVYWSASALPLSEAVFDPIFNASTDPHGGFIDSLYAYMAAGNARKKKLSPYEGRLCAIRWHDPDPGREQGRCMWFGFPLYYMKDNQAQETFNRAVDWFREEVAVPASPSGS